MLRVHAEYAEFIPDDWDGSPPPDGPAKLTLFGGSCPTVLTLDVQAESDDQALELVAPVLEHWQRVFRFGQPQRVVVVG